MRPNISAIGALPESMHPATSLIGKETKELVEGSGKTRLMLITDGLRYLPHRHPLAAEQFERMSHSTFQSIIEYRHAKARLEGALEFRFAHAHRARNIKRAGRDAQLRREHFSRHIESPLLALGRCGQYTLVIGTKPYSQNFAQQLERLGFCV